MKKVSLGLGYALLSLAVLTACSFSNGASSKESESKNVEVIKAEEPTPAVETSDTVDETSETTPFETEQSSEIQTDSLESTDTSFETTTTSENEEAPEVEPMMKEFVEKLLNFESIDKRNQSLREYLTEKAIQDNSIDVKTNAEFTSKGEVQGIYHSLESDDEYLVLSSEESRGTKQNDLITIRVIQENGAYKINGFSIEYVGQA